MSSIPARISVSSLWQDCVFATCSASQLLVIWQRPILCHYDSTPGYRGYVARCSLDHRCVVGCPGVSWMLNAYVGACHCPIWTSLCRIVASVLLQDVIVGAVGLLDVSMPPSWRFADRGCFDLPWWQATSMVNCPRPLPLVLSDAWLGRCTHLISLAAVIA